MQIIITLKTFSSVAWWLVIISFVWRRNRRTRIIVIIGTVWRRTERRSVLRRKTKYSLRIACNISGTRRIETLAEIVEHEKTEENGESAQDDKSNDFRPRVSVVISVTKGCRVSTAQRTRIHRSPPPCIDVVGTCIRIRTSSNDVILI
jgi:hypothetical protein